MRFDEYELGQLNIDVIDGDRGKNYPHQDELLESGFCVFLSANNVTSTGFKFDSIVYITEEKDKLLRNGKLNRNDIVITTRGTLGNIALYDDTVPFNEMRINSGMLIVRCHEGVDTKYLYNVLRGAKFQKQIQQIKTGTAQPQLPKSHFLKMRIDLPPLEKQKKIAEILSIIDSKIKTNECINDNLSLQASTIYHAWFEDFIPFDGTCPFTWNQGTLADIANITSGKRPPIKFAEKTNTAVIPLVGAASVMGYTTEANHTGKILITGRVGTHGVIQRFNSPCWATDNTLVISSNLYEYTYQILKRIDYHAMNRGSTQPLITQSDMNKVSILIPDQKTLDNFETLVGKLMDQYEANVLENNKLAELRNALLPKLMSGELDVSGLEGEFRVSEL